MAKPPSSVRHRHRHRNPPPKPPQTPPSAQKPPPAPPPPQRQPQEHQIVNSLSELDNLCNAIQTFKRNFDELKHLLNYIENGVVSLSWQVQELLERTQKPTKKFDLNRICVDMNGKGLLDYVRINLRNPNNKLKQRLPLALRLAPNPGKLVLESLTDFHTQGNVALANNRSLALCRNALLMILELFFLMEGEGEEECGCGIDGEVKREAESIAVAWRKRIDSEGGLERANEIDVRGLLLLVVGFGIRTVFRSGFVWELVVRCDLEQAAAVLRRSRNFVAWVAGNVSSMILGI